MKIFAESGERMDEKKNSNFNRAILMDSIQRQTFENE